MSIEQSVLSVFTELSSTEDKYGGPWVLGLSRCRLCGHEEVAVAPIEIMENTEGMMECGECGQLQLQFLSVLGKEPDE